jgi:hypothetical protein
VDVVCVGDSVPSSDPGTVDVDSSIACYVQASRCIDNRRPSEERRTRAQLHWQHAAVKNVSCEHSNSNLCEEHSDPLQVPRGLAPHRSLDQRVRFVAVRRQRHQPGWEDGQD